MRGGSLGNVDPPTRIVAADGHRIPYVSVAPAGATSVVVMAHGLGSDRDESGRMFKRLGSALEQYGIASLRFDFRGNGMSEWSHRDVNLDGYLADLAAIAAFASEMWESVILLGASHGGLVSVLFSATAMDAARLRGLVLWNPVLCPREVLVEPGRRSSESLSRSAPVTTSRPFEISSELTRQWADTEIEETVRRGLAQFQRPVLIVHGTEDLVVPVAHSRSIESLSALISLVEVAGAGHGLVEGQIEAIQSTLAFVLTAV
jgi:uncharacterized protein